MDGKLMDAQQPPTNPMPKPSPEIKKSHLGLVVYIVVVVLLIVGVSILAVHDHDKNKKNPENTVSSSSIAPAEVSITKTGFIPQAVTINVGQAVTWTNNDKSVHQVASDPYPMDNTLPGLNSKQAIYRLILIPMYLIKLVHIYITTT